MSLSEVSQRCYSPEEIAGMLNELGYAAEIEPRSEGSHVIRCSKARYGFSLYLDGYKGQSSELLGIMQFVAWVRAKTPLETINFWNSAARWVKVYRARGQLTQDQNLTFEWDVVMHHVSPAFFKACVGLWEEALDKAEDLPLA